MGSTEPDEEIMVEEEEEDENHQSDTNSGASGSGSGGGGEGMEDLIKLSNLSESVVLSNLRRRYENEETYTFIGSILLSVNPYKMLDTYGLDVVKKYEGKILGTQPPHLFAIGSAAYSKMSKDLEDQVVVICGESGAGKTESTKLIMQYLAAVNKSPSNIITEQILEANPLLESFGNAKTVRNNNSSRFGKYLEVHFKEGLITGARVTEYLLEKSRIVAQAPSERNYHVFYELLAGLTDEEKEKYGLQSAEKYFYLNQGACFEIEGKNDGEDFRFLLAAMQVLGFTNEEQDTIFRMLASVLHLGNIYFNRKQMKHGQEGVEIGSDVEIRWVSHLLQLPVEGILKALTSRVTEARNERMYSPLNIDQSLDVRDAIARALYSSLFSWLVSRINLMVYKGSRRRTIALLDIFGFENFPVNSFEQLCINYANETLQHFFNKYIFKLEQQEYLKEKIQWNPLSYPDNQNILHLIAKKPVGIMPLLDDESNFPKATDASFLEKCHFNHALNELYSRPRLSSLEFGIKHYAGQVWYTVDGFLDKNRDTLRSDVLTVLMSSKMPMVAKIFYDLRCTYESNKTLNRSDGRFVTMKPRAATVSSRFQDSLNSLLETMSKCNPWFVRCIKPNNEKVAMKYDTTVVKEQIRHLGILETIRIRKLGYPVRVSFNGFLARFGCLISTKSTRNLSHREICKLIIEKVPASKDDYQLAATKVFMKEALDNLLEKQRVEVLKKAALTIQKSMRTYLHKNRYQRIKQNVVRIQAAYRGHRCRQQYKTVRKGIIQAQATWRMKMQKRRYEEIKAVLRRKRESEKSAAEAAKARAKEEAERASRAVAAVNHLEIPAELALVFSKLEGWHSPHNEKHIAKAVGQIKSPRQKLQLPVDIDHHQFTKFTNIYFRAHIWGMKREPIKTPFLAKTNDVDTQDSLTTFKLILRFMNDNNLSGRKEKALADYIVQKGLSNEAMRDEILCQLCNQTWKNENETNAERGWQLMAHCLSAFKPSPLLYKYLLKYVSDSGFDGYKYICQHKLLESEYTEPQNCRTYPPSLLEWKSSLKKSNMALEGAFADYESKFAPIDSWTTAENFAADLVESRGLDETFGWTVDLVDDGDVFGLNGDDYVLDAISEIEIPPSFPVCKSYFLNSPDRSKGNQNKASTSPHNAERINKLYMDIAELTQEERRISRNSPRKMDINGQVRAKSVSREHLVQEDPTNGKHFTESPKPVQNERPKSSKQETDLNLSRSSKLNQRYLAGQTEEKPDLKLSKTCKLNQRYKMPHSPQVSENVPITSSENNNKKISPTAASEDSKYTQRRSLSMQELGLACSALNDRYFASRQALHKASSLTGDSEIAETQLSRIPSAISLQEHRKCDESGRGPFVEGRTIADQMKSILPTSSRSSSSLSSISHGEIYSTNVDDITTSQGTRDKATEFNSRYVKYTGRPGGSQSKYPPYSHSTKAYIDRTSNKDTEYGFAPRSSGLSDTSEAPSLASHVKNIKIPSHTSDLDQYLDDLFNPVLDGNLDELSDARSLAASIKGDYGAYELDYAEMESIRRRERDFRELIGRSFGGEVKLADPNREDYTTSRHLTDLCIDTRSLDALNDDKKLARKMKGGGAGDSVTFGMSESREIPPFNPEAAEKAMQQGPPTVNTTMAFTNVAGMTVPMVDTSQIIQQQLVHQQMIQRAFLASAVQQNLQIQQQLLQQNQALQQLLNTSASSPSIPSDGNTSSLSPAPGIQSLSPLLQPLSLLQTVPLDLNVLNIGGASSVPFASPNFNLLTPGEIRPENTSSRVGTPSSMTGRKTELPKQPSNIPPPPPPPPPSPPPLSPNSSYTDVYGRAKTVRIGKWRWPPPQEDAQGATATSFLEFKLKKQQQKCDRNGDMDRFEEEPSGPSGGDTPQMKRSEPKSTTNNIHNNHHNHYNNNNRNHNNSNHNGNSRALEQKAMRSSTTSLNNKSNENVGKLRISSEMKAKLEQLTTDQSVRSKKGSKEKIVRSMEDIRVDGVKKLSEQRKSLLEKQLMGSLKALSEVGNYDGRPKGSPKPFRTDSVDKVNTKVVQSGFMERSGEVGQSEGLMRFSASRRSGSRETRERRDELGPHNRMSTNTSTVNAECGDRFSISTAGGTFFDQFSARNSIAYEESVTSSMVVMKTENEQYNSRPVKRMSVPPPPPPIVQNMRPETQGHSGGYHQPSPSMNSNGGPGEQHNGKRSRHGKGTFEHNLDRLSLDRLEFIETSDFLNPIEVPAPFVNRKDQRALDAIKTKLYVPPKTYHLTYNKVAWELRLRKEVFLPNERIESPMTLHIIFCQVVRDVFAPNCLRLTKEERQKFQKQLHNYGITMDNLNSSSHKLPVQRNIIELAKEMPTYFARIYPVSGGRNLPNVSLLGVSHSGIRLIQREKDSGVDHLRIMDTVKFEDLSEILTPQSCTIQLVLQNGGWFTLHSYKATQIRRLIEKFLYEIKKSEAEFVKAISDYEAKEASILSFHKGDIIRIVSNKNLRIAKGWLYGVLDTGEGGLVPCEYVVPLSKDEMQKLRHKMDEIKQYLQNGKSSESRKVSPNEEDQGKSAISQKHSDDSSPSSLWIETKMEQQFDNKSESTHASQLPDRRYSLLQFAITNFRDAISRYEMVNNNDSSPNGTLKLIESLKSRKKQKKNKNSDGSDWTWKELSDLVKYTKNPLSNSLLKLPTSELNKAALECFMSIMRFMGDHPLGKHQTDVDCVYAVLMCCHKYPPLHDEVYCQLMKQTTNNKSPKHDSCLRGWRLFSIVTAYFDCSENLRPYLLKYLETAAFDKRRLHHGAAMICLQNVRKTFKYGGRKNVPSVEEIAAIAAGRNSKRQMYRLPGGTERIINTNASTVVADIIQEICEMLGVDNPIEMEEFSLYCIVEGDPYTMPLNREEYILDVTTELLKTGQIFYLIFCRSVWYYPLRLDNKLYIEVIFNQVAPDYLEGLLLVTPNDNLTENVIPDIARIAALLHRAADMDHMPTKEEVKYLLPKPVLPMKEIRPPVWVEMVQRNWSDMSAITTTEAKAQCLDILQKWSLFGSCFFAIKRIQPDSHNHPEFILALNKDGAHFLDLGTHDTIWSYPYSEIISTRKVRAEDGTLYLDMKCGNLMVQKITRIQTDQAHEISRLIRQYINIQNSEKEQNEVAQSTTSAASEMPT